MEPVSQGDRPRPELLAIHELELDALTQTGEQRRPVYHRRLGLSGSACARPIRRVITGTRYVTQ